MIVGEAFCLMIHQSPGCKAQLCISVGVQKRLFTLFIICPASPLPYIPLKRGCFFKVTATSKRKILSATGPFIKSSIWLSVSFSVEQDTCTVLSGFSLFNYKYFPRHWEGCRLEKYSQAHSGGRRKGEKDCKEKIGERICCWLFCSFIQVVARYLIVNL